jgi:hypothetical protein
MLSARGLEIADRKIDEYGPAGGINIGRGNLSTEIRHI